MGGSGVEMWGAGCDLALSVVLRVSAGAGRVRMTVAEASLGGPAGAYAGDGHSWTKEPSGENGRGVRA